MDDLITFSKAKDYYAKLGKVWKRGRASSLCYGPPGTGNSTSIAAAMANLLHYDGYDFGACTGERIVVFTTSYVENLDRSCLYTIFSPYRLCSHLSVVTHQTIVQELQVLMTFK